MDNVNRMNCNLSMHATRTRLPNLSTYTSPTHLLTSYFLGLPTPRYVPAAGALLYSPCCTPPAEYPCPSGVYGFGLGIGVKLCPLPNPCIFVPGTPTPRAPPGRRRCCDTFGMGRGCCCWYTGRCCCCCWWWWWDGGCC